MISGGMLAGYYVYETRMKTYPPIHDVATNWERPVTFSRMLIEQRGPEANPIEDNPYVAKGVSYEWKGQSVAAVNLETCPQAKGILNKKVTADQVVTILRAENYQVVGRSDWRVEATYEDPFWGWKSDVVVRLDSGRIDLRSVSREAQADLGGNCRRITRLVNLIKAA
jgi:uncharacterized protein (DUF1499 family)